MPDTANMTLIITVIDHSIGGKDAVQSVASSGGIPWDYSAEKAALIIQRLVELSDLDDVYDKLKTSGNLPLGVD